MRFAALLVALLAGLWATGAAAQSDPLPNFAHTSVNDFAGVLGPDDTRTLDQALIALNRETGVQGTVVTLPERARYGAGSVETFARRLFDAWGVGDAQRNDGFMVLLLPAEREVRIELGAGYAGAWDAEAARIVERDMLPAFRDGRMPAGLTAGTLAVISEIARPAAQGRAPPQSQGFGGSGSGGGIERVLPFAVFGVIGFSLFNLVRGVGRRRRANDCPQCGAALSVTEDVVRDPPADGSVEAGSPIVRRTCPSCGWSSEQLQGRSRSWGPVIGPFGRSFGGDRATRSSGWRGGGGGRGGGFGGGRGGGGGASGRW